MNDATFKQLLSKYEKGTASAAERHVVEQWYASFDKTADSETIWANEAAKASTRERIWRAARGQQPAPPSLMPRFFKVAAAVLAVLTAGLLLWRPAGDGQQPVAGHPAAPASQQLVRTSGQQVKRALLPDSSQVWLNANSSIAIPENYGAHNRSVRLTGEAFFDVRPDTARPFVITSQTITVSVLGTSFNVRAYDGLEEVQVAVSTGRVSVADSAQRMLADLMKDDLLTYNRRSGAVAVGKTDGGLSSAWREGRIIFENERFETLAQGFYNLFGVKLLTVDEEVATLRYNLVLHHGMTEEKAINMICKVVNKQYRKEGNERIVIY